MINCIISWIPYTNGVMLLITRAHHEEPSKRKYSDLLGCNVVAVII